MADNEDYDQETPGELLAFGQLTPERMLRDQRLWSHRFEQKMERRFAEVSKRFDKVELQTTTTNGRVTKLEKFQYLVTGGLVVIMALVVPLFLDLMETN